MSLVGLTRSSSSYPFSSSTTTQHNTQSSHRQTPPYLKFPFTPYYCQISLINKVHETLSGNVSIDRDGRECNGSNALLESPTGTGKTLCLLLTTLSYLKSTSSPSPLIYASRTHGQLNQVVKEERMRRGGKITVLGSRKHFCINSKVNNPQSVQDGTVDRKCGALCKDRKCQFRNNVERMQDDCWTSEVADVEDFISACKSAKVCPYYHEREVLKRTPDQRGRAIFMPYNYVFDQDVMGEVNVLRGAVVVLDEGHNISGVCMDNGSASISVTDIANGVDECDRSAGLGDDVFIDKKHLMTLKSILLDLEKVIETERERDGPGRMARDILRKAKLTFATSLVIDKFVEQVIDVLEGSEVKANGLKKCRLFFKRVFGGENEVELEKREAGYSTCLEGRKQGTPKTLSFFCLTPSIGIRQLVDRGTRNVMVVSGTLSPLEVFEQESGVRFHVQHSGGHVVPKEQIFVASSGVGIRRKPLKNTYDRREDPEQYKELGLTIVSAIKTAPGGVLVFFPSYGNMEECVRRWGGEDLSKRGGKKEFFRKIGDSPFWLDYLGPITPGAGSTSILRRIRSYKTVVIEPRRVEDMDALMTRYYSLIGENKGGVIFAVCRGKVSEGMDFKDGYCRMVIVAGLPLMPVKDKKVKAMREFMDRKHLALKEDKDANGGTITGSAWYNLQASISVNQCVGRVLRHKMDFGAILFLDSRFGKNMNGMRGVSKWVSEEVVYGEEVGWGGVLKRLGDFYGSIKQNKELMKIAPMGGKKYEEGGFDEDVRKERRGRAQVVDSGAYIDLTDNTITAVVPASGASGGYFADAEFKSKQSSIEEIERIGRAAEVIVQGEKKQEKRKDGLMGLFGGKGMGFTASKKTLELKMDEGEREMENEAPELPSPPPTTVATNPYLAKAMSKNRGLMNSKLHKDMEAKKVEVRRRKREIHEGLKKPLSQGLEWAGGGTMQIPAASVASAAPATSTTSNADTITRQNNINQFGKLLSSVASGEEIEIIKGLLAAVKSKWSRGERSQIPPVCKDIVDVFLRYNQSVGRDLVVKLQAIVPKDVRGMVMEEWRKGLVRRAQGEMKKGIENRRKGIYDGLEEIVVDDGGKIKPSNPLVVNFSSEKEQTAYREKLESQGRGKEIRLAKEMESRRIVDAHRRKSKKPIIAPTSSKQSTVRPSKRAKLLSAANPAINSFMHTLKPKSPTRQSSVPSSVECNICREIPKDPHIAECKHIACKVCWDKWIKVQKGERKCMVCKSELGDLAKCVFK